MDPKGYNKLHTVRLHGSFSWHPWRWYYHARFLSRQKGGPDTDQPRVVIASVIVAAAAWIHSGSLFTGAALGGGFFLARALARELDPPTTCRHLSPLLSFLFFTLHDSLDPGVIFLVTSPIKADFRDIRL